RHLLLHPPFSTDAAPTHLDTLSLHDALPIYTDPEFAGQGQIIVDQQLSTVLRAQRSQLAGLFPPAHADPALVPVLQESGTAGQRSEEHTSELQSRENLVCRLLLEKKKGNRKT